MAAFDFSLVSFNFFSLRIFSFSVWFIDLVFYMASLTDAYYEEESFTAFDFFGF